MPKTERVRTFEAEIEAAVITAKMEAHKILEATPDRPNVLDHAYRAATAIGRAMAYRELLDELNRD